MQFVPMLIAIAAAFHAYTYAQWLKDNGNSIGAYGVYVIILIGLILPVYRIVVSGF